MPHRQKDQSRPAWRTYLLPLLAATFLSLAALVILQRVERFLIHDQRLVLRPGSLPGLDAPDLRITGLNRTPAARIREVFARDEGRSVFLLPLAERRQQLLAIEWVKEASVGRLWPNRIEVWVKERQPEAFVRLPGRRRGAPSRVMLIDAAGVLLPVPERTSFDLPVLAGIREDQTQAERAARLKLMKGLLDELGKLAEPVSEIDVTDAANLKVDYQVEDRAVILILGNEKYAERIAKFLQYYGEIRKRVPNAVTIDLRLPDRITALEEQDNGG